MRTTGQYRTEQVKTLSGKKNLRRTGATGYEWPVLLFLRSCCRKTSADVGARAALARTVEQEDVA
jgi:hypothetical protein